MNQKGGVGGRTEHIYNKPFQNLVDYYHAAGREEKEKSWEKGGKASKSLK